MILNRILPILLVISLSSHANQIAPAKFRFADGIHNWTWYDSLEAAAEAYAKNFCAETTSWTWRSNCSFKNVQAGISNDGSGRIDGWAGDLYYTLNYYDGTPPPDDRGPFPGKGGWGATLCPQQFLFDKRGFCFLPDDVALRHSITHNFIYPPQVYDLMTDSSDELGCGRVCDGGAGRQAAEQPAGEAG
jgi:hypothetical protein